MVKRCCLILFILLSACSPAQDSAELPTLAVLPTLTPTATPVPIRPLAFWEAGAGNLESPSQVDRWRFEAQAGDVITLRTLGPVTLTLEREGAPVAGPGTEIETRLVAGGTYLVAVQLAQAESGAYEIGLGYADRPNPASFTATPPPLTVGVPTPTPVAELGDFISVLRPGESLAGSFADRRRDQGHIYTFAGISGEYITLTLAATSGGVNPLLRLFGPGDELLAVDGGSGGDRVALLRGIPIREGGLYRVQALSGGLPGGYQITLASDTAPPPVTPTIIPQPTLQPPGAPVNPTPAPVEANALLVDHVPVIGSISRPGFVQRYFFSAQPGDFASIGVRPLDAPGLPLVIDVISPAGDVMQSAGVSDPESDGEALAALLPITESERYTVLVTAENGATGQFILTYGTGLSREEVQRGQASADAPADGLIARRGLREVWQVALYAGDVITATVNPLTDTLDPVLELVAPDGTLVAMDDNSGGFPVPLLRDVRAPVTGVYEMRVTGANAASIGPYRLVWRYISVAPTATPAAPFYPLLTLQDEIGEGEYLFYPFQGQAGQQVRIQVLAEAGSDLDPVAVLYGPDGGQVAEGDDSNGDLNPRFIARLPVDGTYTLRVNGYLSGGRFSVLVDRLLP